MSISLGIYVRPIYPPAAFMRADFGRFWPFAAESICPLSWQLSP